MERTSLSANALAELAATTPVSLWAIGHGRVRGSLVCGGNSSPYQLSITHICLRKGFLSRGVACYAPTAGSGPGARSMSARGSTRPYEGRARHGRRTPPVPSPPAPRSKMAIEARNSSRRRHSGRAAGYGASATPCQGEDRGEGRMPRYSPSPGPPAAGRPLPQRERDCVALAHTKEGPSRPLETSGARVGSPAARPLRGQRVKASAEGVTAKSGNARRDVGAGLRPGPHSGFPGRSGDRPLRQGCATIPTKIGHTLRR